MSDLSLNITSHIWLQMLFKINQIVNVPYIAGIYNAVIFWWFPSTKNTAIDTTIDTDIIKYTLCKYI